MAREFALDENNQLVEVVRTHQNADLGQLEGEVTNLEAQYAQAVTDAEAANNRVAELSGQLEDSKRDVETARGLVGAVVETPAEGVDGGTDDSGSEVSDTVEESTSDSTSVDGISVNF